MNGKPAESASALVGFSINPEIVWEIQRQEGERSIGIPDIFVAGTSYNVACALRACGITPMLLGAVGPDDNRTDKFLNAGMKQLLENENMMHQLLPIRKSTPLADTTPGQKNRKSWKQPIVKVDTAEIERKVLSLKPEFTIATGVAHTAEEISAAAALLSHGTKVLIPSYILLKENPSGFESLLERADMVVMNQYEAIAYLQITEDKLRPEALLPLLESNVKHAVVTMGAKGAIAATKHQGHRLWIQPMEVEAVDESGAGDCFTGFLIGAMQRGGFTFNQALKLASTAGALKAMRLGANNIPAWLDVYQCAVLRNVL